MAIYYQIFLLEAVWAKAHSNDHANNYVGYLADQGTMTSSCGLIYKRNLPLGTDWGTKNCYATIGISDYTGISLTAEHIQNNVVRYERSVSAYYAGQIRNGGVVRESRNDVTLQLVQSNTATIAAQCDKPTGLEAPRLNEDNEIKVKLLI